MAKEVLQISAKRVIVDYDFRNDSDEDITTEVAFPIRTTTFLWKTTSRHSKASTTSDFGSMGLHSLPGGSQSVLEEPEYQIAARYAC